MDSNELFQKAQILINQKRYDAAEKLLKDLLSHDPNDVGALLLMSELHIQRDNLEKAETIVDMAIGIAPDYDHLFYNKSRIALMRSDTTLAEKYIMQAINLDPSDAHYYALRGQMKLLEKNYKKALEYSDQALALNAENVLALNIRSTALNKLDRAEESFVTIEGALREDPNNAYTHANYGWGLLEKGNHEKAKEHFMEALRVDPNYEHAKSGMGEAIKATNPLYKLFLKYAFWMSNLSSNNQWIFIIGFYFGVRTLRTLAASNPAIQPFVTPLIILLTVFAFSTWVISPVSDLFLRFNKYGHFLLTKKEKISSNFVAVSLLTSIVGLVAYFVLSDARFLTICAYGFGMMIPLSVMFRPAKYKGSLLLYTGGMALVGLVAIVLAFQSGDLLNPMSIVFLGGIFLFQWIANFLMIR